MGRRIGYSHHEVQGRHLGGEGVQVRHLIDLVIVNQRLAAFRLESGTFLGGVTILQIDKLDSRNFSKGVEFIQ